MGTGDKAPAQKPKDEARHGEDRSESEPQSEAEAESFAKCEFAHLMFVTFSFPFCIPGIAFRLDTLATPIRACYSCHQCWRSLLAATNQARVRAGHR